jgi:indole-3-acetate monooxygenase
MPPQLLTDRLVGPNVHFTREDGARTMTGDLSVGSALNRARALTPLIEASATQSEQMGTLKPSIVAALVESGLPWMLTPKEAGGEGESLIATLNVIEELTRADASAGWCYMVTTVSTALVAAYSGEDAIAKIYKPGAMPLMAGMTAPRGQAHVVDGGYECFGRYSFGSGARHATWIKSGALVYKDGNTVEGPGGVAEQIAYVVPAEEARLLGNWNVLGLKATGSVDYEVPRQFVPEEFTFSTVSARQQRGRSSFQLGVKGMAAAGHSAVAVGIALRALVEISEIAQRKVRPGLPSVSERELFRHDLAFHDAAVRSARAFVWEVVDEAERSVESGDPLSNDRYQRIRQACTYAHQVGADAVRFAYGWAGTTSLREPSVLGRTFRDMAGATQHFYVDPSTFVDAAPVVLQALSTLH